MSILLEFIAEIALTSTPCQHAADKFGRRSLKILISGRQKIVFPIFRVCSFNYTFKKCEHVPQCERAERQIISAFMQDEWFLLNNGRIERPTAPARNAKELFILTKLRGEKLKYRRIFLIAWCY